MGAAFKYSTWPDNRYGGNMRSGPDFLEETKARAASSPEEYYEIVSRLESLAECLGETVDENLNSSKFWRSLALAERKKLAASRSTGCRPCRLPVTTGKVVQETRSTKDCSLAPFNSIVIPAENFVDSSGNENVLVMPSYTSGNQIHLEADGFVTYRVPEIVERGNYMFSLLLVNVHRRQAPIDLVVGDSSQHQKYTIKVQYSGGKWASSEPIAVAIQPTDFITLSRETTAHGLTIKELRFVAPKKLS